MATYYWVGGAGEWTTFGTAKWSASSGGAGGAGVPTAADNVIFDANSGTGTVSALSASCLDMTASSSSALTIGGSVSIHGNMVIGGSATFTTLQPTFKSTTTGKTVTTNAKTISNITFDGVGGAWTLQDALTTTGTLTVTNGTFNANNFAISASGFNSSNSNVRTVNLGSSTLTLSGGTPINITTSTNLTFNAGTSTINCTFNAITVFGGSVTYYNLSFTGGTTNSVSINGANTFNNLSVTATVAGTRTVTFAANQTINGSLTTSGTTSTQRVQFGSSVAGTQRTISLATAGTLTNTNWQDIALTGAASPWTAPIGVIDLKNNTGITFDTTTLYWVGGAGTWTDAAKWSTSSGGGGGAGVPGSTNNVVFDASSGTGTVTGTFVSPNNYCKDFDSSASSLTTTNFAIYIYGSFKGRSGVSNTFGAMYFSGSGTHTIDPNGATNMVNGSGVAVLGTGTYTLMNNWVSSNSFGYSAGTFNTNGYSLSTNAFSISGATTKVLNLGASTITITGASGFNSSTATNLTFNAGTSTISTNGTFNAGAGLTFYNVSLNSTSVLISGTNTYNNLTLVGPTSSNASAFNFNGNQVVNGTFTTTGSNGNQRVVVLTDDLVTQRTITAATVSITDTDFYKITGAGGGSWTGTRIGNGGGNSGITFTTPKTVYWNLVGGGNTLSSVAWATSSGGTPATTNYPLGQDTAIVEDTGLNSGATLSWPTPYMVIPALTFATRTLPVTLSITNTLLAPSNITLSSAVTRSGTQTVLFTGNTTLTTAGVTWTNSINVYGSLTLGSALSTSAQITVNTGTLNLAGFNLTSSGQFSFLSGTLNLANAIYSCVSFSSNNTGTRVIQFGTGAITVTGSGSFLVNINGVNLTYTGTPTVNVSNNSATTSSFIFTGFTETNAFNVNYTTGTYSLQETAAIYRNVNFTGFAGSIGGSGRTIFGNWTSPAGLTGTVSASTTTFAATSGTQTITTNGLTLDFPITKSGVGGTVQLNGSLTLGSTRTLEVSSGTFDANNNNVTAGLFKADGSNVRSVLMGSGTWTIAGTGVVWNIGSGITGLTLNAGTSTIVLSDTSATARTFSGGGLTYNNLTIGGTAGTSTLTFTGSNTFNTLSSTKTVAHTILFTASTTNTFTTFNINGTAGNVVTIGSVTASSHTLAKAGGGTVTADYLSISRSTATPTLTWLATNSTDGGNNSGWYFGAFPPPSNGNFFLLF